jgi:sec-independent protein translocase protein TatA
MLKFLLLFDISGGEFLLIIIFVVMFFGAKSIPDMAKGLAKVMREVKDASNNIKREITDSAKETEDDFKNIIPKDMGKWIEEIPRSIDDSDKFEINQNEWDQPVVKPISDQLTSSMEKDSSPDETP